jgi:uncharacterized protein with ParB-like and HNH nuclease domain
MSDEEDDEEIKIDDKLTESDSDELIHFRYQISSYGADYPVDALVKRLRETDIFIPPFQRLFVWDRERSSRFIESLLLGLPVPGIFLSKETDSQKLLVIDGQQRLATLLYFYEGMFADKHEFSLKGVQSEFEGLTYKTLKDDDRRRLNDSILHATVVKQDKPSKDDSSIYYIFERLNTGGMILHPQEIRAAIYHGKFNEILNKLNQNKSWRAIYGRESKRMRDRELILRFLALYFTPNLEENYKAPMKEFLNNYMAENKKLEKESEQYLTSAFVNTVGVAHQALGQDAFRPYVQLNAAVYDSVMVGLARRLQKGTMKDLKGFQNAYRELTADNDYVKLTESRTADEQSVRRRIALAIDAFADVK